MSVLQIGMGIISGIFIISGGFSLLLFRRQFEKEINLNYALLSFTIIVYLYGATLYFYVNSIEEIIFIEKFTNLFLIVSGFLLIRLVVSLTNYRNKIWINGLFSGCALLLILNFILPYSILYDEVHGYNELNLIWGEKINVVNVSLSYSALPILIFLVFVMIFIAKSTYYLYSNGNGDDAKVFFISISIAVLMVLLDAILSEHSYLGFSILKNFGLIFFSVVITHRNFKNVFKAYLLKQELKEGEERLRLVLESTNDAIWDLNLISNNLYLSNRYYEILNYAPDDFSQTYDNWIKRIHPEDLTVQEQIFQDMINCKIEHFSIDQRIKKKDGSWLWISTKGKVVEKSADGTPVRLVGIHTDINTKKLSEKDLEIKNSILSKINEMSIDLASFSSENNLHVYLAQKLKSFTGALGVTLGEYIESERVIVPRILDIDSKLISFIKNMTKFDLSRTVSPVNEETYNEMISLTAVFKNTLSELSFGAIPHVVSQMVKTILGIDKFAAVAYVYDNILYGTSILVFRKEQELPSIDFLKSFAAVAAVSLRRWSSEASLKESEERFRSLYKNSTIGLYRTSQNGQILMANPSLVKMLGYDSFEELSKRNLKSEGFQSSTPRELFTKNIESKGIVLGLESKWKRKDGSIIYVRESAKAVKDQSGVILYYDGTVEDITEKKRLEQQLEIRQRMDSIGTLAGGIAHDFNNLLTGILGYLSIIEKSKNLDEKFKRYIKNAIQSGRRASDLTKQLQSLSGTDISEMKSIDLFDIANEVFNLLDKVTDKIIDKKNRIEKNKYYIHGNVSELHQVFLNMGTNSYQAILERGCKNGDYIKIWAEEFTASGYDRTGLPAGNYIHIYFEDNGIGMSENTLRRAFDPLFTTKSKGSQRGQGLGLAMVYNIITRRHKGLVEIESKTGKGTTFHVYLKKGDKTDLEKFNPDVSVYYGTETILVVEDEDFILEIAETILTTHGYNVISATDGIKGVEIYREKKNIIDLVILDLTMPGMTGVDVLKNTLMINPEAKVIICSGHSSTGNEIPNDSLAKVKGFIHKPYESNDFIRQVRKVLDASE